MNFFLTFLVWWFFSHNFCWIFSFNVLDMQWRWFSCLYTVAWLCVLSVFCLKDWSLLLSFFWNECVKNVFNQICFFTMVASEFSDCYGWVTKKRSWWLCCELTCDKEHFFFKYHLSQKDTCHLEVDPKPPIVEPYLSK